MLLEWRVDRNRETRSFAAFSLETALVAALLIALSAGSA
jgi:hypothetical protein